MEVVVAEYNLNDWIFAMGLMATSDDIVNDTPWPFFGCDNNKPDELEQITPSNRLVSFPVLGF